MATRRKKRGLGDYGSDEYVDAAFRAAEDGDCPRVEKNLTAAERAGANVAAVRKQLSRQCKGGELHGVESNEEEYRRARRRANELRREGSTHEAEAYEKQATLALHAGRNSKEAWAKREWTRAAANAGWNVEQVEAKRLGIDSRKDPYLEGVAVKKSAKRCDKIVTKKGPKVHGKYCERIVTSLKELHPGSIKTLVFDGGKRVVIIGCRPGKWKKGKCAEGTKAHAVLKRVK